MSFPLLKLPYLAIEKVLFHFEPIDLFDISFCSARSYFLVRSLRHPYPLLSIHISTYKNIKLCSGKTHVSLPEPPYIQRVKSAHWSFIWGNSKKIRKQNEKLGQVRKIGGVEFKAGKDDCCLTMSSPKEEMRSVVKYIQDLFKVPIHSMSFSSGGDRKLLPQYFGFQKCEDFTLFSFGNKKILSDDTIRGLIDNLKVTKHLSLSLQGNPDFRHDAARFSTDQLDVFDARWMSRNTFLSLDCAKISLNYTSFTSMDFKELVSRWYNSGNDRMVWLKMRVGFSWPPLDWTEFQAKPWDPNVRGHWFRMTSLNYHKSTHKLDCSAGMDITRPSDGLTATIVSRGTQMYFVVWHERFPNCDGLNHDIFN